MKVKKLATIVAAFAMVMVMSVPTFAATIPTSKTGGGENDALIVSTDTTLNIEKPLTVYNANLTAVDGPGIAYSYTIAPATGSAVGMTVTDASSNVGTVHSGPADGLVISDTPEFPIGTMVAATSAGAENTDNIVLSVDLTKFTAPGIYRYVLTDTTTDAALIAAGVVRTADYNDVRFVDVYIERNASDALVVKGYVVSEDTDGDGVPDAKATYDPDAYHTYNIVLNKNVTGSMGDRQNQFSFDGTVGGNDGKAFYVKKGSAPVAGTDASQTTTALSTTLAHGESYYISGLSPHATIAYTETNNTPDAYKVTVLDSNSSAIVAQSAVAAGSTKVMSAQAVTNYDTVNTTAPNTQETATSVSSVTFENNFESVSPTGVVLRYGAPLLVLAAAIVLVALNRKAKKANSVR